MDKSPQGFYDQDIIPLLNIINKNSSLQTTSSCSGRITLMKGVKKGQSEWLYKTHTEANFKEINQTLQQHQDEIRFLFEPLIIHIKCKDQNTISNLLTLLHQNGFKKSCIISTKNNILEVNDTGKMETILRRDLINTDYLNLLIKEANKRLKKTKENIKKLEKLFSNQSYQQCQSQHHQDHINHYPPV